MISSKQSNVSAKKKYVKAWLRMTGTYPNPTQAPAGIANSSSVAQLEPARRPTRPAAVIVPKARHTFNHISEAGPENLSSPKKIVPAPHSWSTYSGNT